jgi:hypothetical protein
MLVENSLVHPPDGGMRGFATGYMDAMHKLCITCHENHVNLEPGSYPASFAQCANCHREIDGTRLHEMKPYVADQANTTE